MNYQYDVVFIGSGHACWHGGMALAMAGKKVAYVECDVTAGTCTNYGCDAKILLDSPFEMVEGLKNYRGIGFDGKVDINWSDLIAYKKKVISVYPVAMEDLFARLNMDLIKGFGRFIDGHTLDVNGKIVTAETIVVGTGEHPVRREFEGHEFTHDSRDFLDAEEFPKRLLLIGAGIISMEFASIGLNLGSEITVVEFSDQALRMYPKKYVNQLVDKMKKEGLDLILNDSVQFIEETEDGYLVTLKSGQTKVVDYILEATGRRPNVQGMNLEAASVKYSERGIVVNDHLKAADSVYASGDVIDKMIPKLTPTATFESNYIAADILNPMNPPINYPVVPNLVFTFPRIAQTGVSVGEAEAHPDLYRIETVPYGQQMLFQSRNEVDMDFTFIFDQQNDLVGTAIYGSDAGTFIDIATMIINKKMTQMELNNMIFAFPTPSYGFISTLMPLLKLM